MGCWKIYERPRIIQSKTLHKKLRLKIARCQNLLPKPHTKFASVSLSPIYSRHLAFKETGFLSYFDTRKIPNAVEDTGLLRASKKQRICEVIGDVSTSSNTSCLRQKCSNNCHNTKEPPSPLTMPLEKPKYSEEEGFHYSRTENSNTSSS